MYTIELTIKNPITGESRRLIYQFNPATMTQAKWTAAFPTVETEINGLVTASEPNEPPTW